MLTFCANQASFLDGIANGRRAPASFSLTGNGDSLVSDGRCKEYTAPRTLHTRNFFLARDSSCSVLFSIQNSHPRARVMFRTLLDLAPFSSTLGTPTFSSLLYPTNRTNPCALQQGLLFGRFAEQSPLKQYVAIDRRLGAHPGSANFVCQFIAAGLH